MGLAGEATSRAGGAAGAGPGLLAPEAPVAVLRLLRGPRAGASGPGAGPEPVLEAGSPAQVTAVGGHVRAHVCTCACVPACACVCGGGARKERLIRQEAA